MSSTTGIKRNTGSYPKKSCHVAININNAA